MADFGWKVNHVIRLISSCLQSLCYSDFGGGDCSPTAPPSPFGCARGDRDVSVCHIILARTGPHPVLVSIQARGDPRLKCRDPLSPVPNAEYLNPYRHFVFLAPYIKQLGEKVLTVTSCRQKGSLMSYFIHVSVVLIDLSRLWTVNLFRVIPLFYSVRVRIRHNTSDRHNCI